MGLFDQMSNKVTEETGKVFLKVIQNTVFKTRPLDSSELFPHELYEVSAGNTLEIDFFIDGDKNDFKGYIRFDLKNSKDHRYSVKTWYVCASHIQVETDGNLILNIIQSTDLKLLPLEAEKLSDEEKYSVVAGTVFRISLFQKENQYYKINLKEPINEFNQWFVLIENVQLTKTLGELLTDIGNSLWDELISEPLKQEYWRFKSRVKSLLITSEEPWIPWEMIKPYRYNDDGDVEQEPFWCQHFAISRWLSMGGTADEMIMGKARPIALTPTGLPSVKEELLFIEQLSTLHSGITPLTAFGTRLQVLDSFTNEEFSILHFACHGTFDATSPNNSAIKLADGDLRPSDIRVQFKGRRPRPLIFINSCHGAREDFSLTGLGGWATMLVSARVGAFIGAMWEVSDGLALQFAKTFYTKLLKENESIAESFRLAREEIRKAAPYNSTWLAYSLYADPEGRVKALPSQTGVLLSEL